MQVRGNVRSTAPGSTFTLTDHPAHDGRDEQRDRFVTLAVRHTARSNLRADHQAQVGALTGVIDAVNAKTSAGHVAHHVLGVPPADVVPNERDEPLHACRAQPQRAAVPPAFDVLLQVTRSQI